MTAASSVSEDPIGVGWAVQHERRWGAYKYATLRVCLVFRSHMLALPEEQIADRRHKSTVSSFKYPAAGKDALKCNRPPYTEAIGHCCCIPALDPSIASCCGRHRARPKPCVSPSNDFSKPRSNCTQGGSGLSSSSLASCRSHGWAF